MHTQSNHVAVFNTTPMKSLSILFGLDGDGTVAHETNCRPGAHAGVLLAGREKFVSFLELHLGLQRPHVHAMDRVLKLKALLAELPNSKLPFKNSWNTDSIGVSRRIIELWDSWRMSGWNPESTQQIFRNGCSK